MCFLRKLKTTGCNMSILWDMFLSLVFCHITYAFPVWCDITSYERNIIQRIEKQALRCCHSQKEPEISERLDKICKRLNSKILSNREQHPLGDFYVERSVQNYVLRNLRRFIPITYRSNLTRKSFLRYHCFQ